MSINGKVTLITRTGPGAMAAIVMLGLLMQAGCATPPQANHDAHERGAPHEHRTTGEPARSVLTTPSAIVTEHEHLHHQLDAAIASGGATGQRAREVAAILESHFEQEEAYAMPPLGLLESLAWNEPLDDATVRQAIRMADRPRDVPLDLWLVDLLDEKLDEKITPAPRMKKSFDQHAIGVRSGDLPEEDEQEWWVGLLDEDETITLKDTISSGDSAAAPEQLEAREMKDRIHALLGALPKTRRQAFVLNVVEAYELFEIAMLQDRPEAEVQADIEAARNTLREQLSADDRSHAARRTQP